MKLFEHFVVYPDWGNGAARISWQLMPDVTGAVYLYRSPLGLSGTWERLNTTPLEATGEYVDDSVPKGDAFAFHYYRGLIAPSADTSTWLKGEAISALSMLTRREYHMVKTIMRREWRDMVRGNGLEALHCVPRLSGAFAAGVDPVMGIRTRPECPDESGFGFGQTYANGFYPPVLTRIRIMKIGEKVEKAKPENTGSEQDKDVSLRLLAFPRPREGHMLVMLGSGRRYVIADAIQPFWFKADHPVAWECRAVLLDARDARSLLDVAFSTTPALDTGAGMLFNEDGDVVAMRLL